MSKCIFSAQHLNIEKYVHGGPKDPINKIHTSQFEDYRDSDLQRGLHYKQQS